MKDKQMIDRRTIDGWTIDNRELLSLKASRSMTNVRQRKILRYKAIKSKWACCFITIPQT
jgi:hypothetical protein